MSETGRPSFFPSRWRGLATVANVVGLCAAVVQLGRLLSSARPDEWAPDQWLTALVTAPRQVVVTVQDDERVRLGPIPGREALVDEIRSHLADASRPQPAV